MNYTNYTNLDSHYMRPYEPGDRLVRGWQGETAIQGNLTGCAEYIYMLHNRDDRPDGRMCPSMSVGDVIVIGEVALSVDLAGFKAVQLDANDILPMSYLEAVR